MDVIYFWIDYYLDNLDLWSSAQAYGHEFMTIKMWNGRHNYENGNYDLLGGDFDETYSFLLPEDGDGELKFNAMMSSTFFSFSYSS